MNKIEKLNQEVEVLKKNNKGIEMYRYSDKIKKKIKNALDDLDVNHNHSLAVDSFLINRDHLDKDAILYRGNKITYKEMYEKAYDYARSLKMMGFGPDSEIPVCIPNSPEFVYLLLATSFIGAKINIVGEWFNHDYLVSILNDTKSNVMFVSDSSYGDIKDAIDKSNIDKIVMFSLTDSLMLDANGNKYNPFQEIDDNFHEFKNKTGMYITDNSNIILEDEFSKIGELYNGNIVEHRNLDDVATITYTSGTTTPGRPKGVIQANRSYITLSRFKDSDVSGMPSMKDLTILAHIPTYTHMELSCAISDTFHCNCTLALEPFYDRDFFPYSLMMNQPNFVPASAGFWVNLCKLLNYDESFKKVNMPYLMIPTVTGEGCSPGEEKFLNKTSRKHKFGTDKLPFPLSPVTFSIGGGTTESSGIFVTLFKALQEKKLNYLIKNATLGLTPLAFAEIEVLDENMDYCKIGQPGMLVANNPCTMVGYTDEKLNKNMYLIDKYGKKWANLGTYAYKSDKTGRIKMKSRPTDVFTLWDGTKVPFYIVEDIILSDTKNIMSCSLVKSNDGHYVCHIETQPSSKKSKFDILNSCVKRLDKKVSGEIVNNIVFRLRDFDESFPLDPSGKRSIKTLKAEKTDERSISPLTIKKLSEENEEKSDINVKKLTK